MNEHDKRFREQKVLEIVVQAYIPLATPISSRYVSRKLGLSSATIRNIMADLEEMGLIEHPHTSAGRKPTDKGYRYYVDTLMHLKKVTELQAKQIELEYHSKIKSLEDMLEKTAHMLSELTGCAGLMLLSKMEQKCFKHIDLVLLSMNRVLALIVTESGFAKDYIIELEYPLDKSLLDKISNFLNNELNNINFEDIKERLIKRLKTERNSSYILIQNAYEIIKAILMSGLEEKLYFDGTSRILSYPEFRDQKKSSNILKFFEDKKVISNVLAEDLSDERLKIRIGSENKAFGLDEFSIITAGFRIRSQVAGRLGIIGPTRMYYDEIIPVVELLSDTISRALS